MIPTHHKAGNIPGRAAACILLVLLHACSSTPEPARDTGRVVIERNVVSGNENTYQNLIAQAAVSASPQKEQLLFQAAQLLRNLDRDEDARLLVQDLDTTTLPLDLTADILLFQARMESDLGQKSRALELLNHPRLDQLPRLSPAVQMAILLYRAELSQASSLPLESVLARIQADKLIPLAMVPTNHEQIWNNLIGLDAGRLTTLAEEERRYEYQGWYELGLIGKAFQYNLDRQVVELARWKTRWGRHPAAVYLPQALQLVESMAEERPNRLALLLPLDTLAGVVIRDAFMSAYFDVMQFGGKVPEVTFYNTSNPEDVMPVYNRAVAAGAEMIIGPLLKQHVAQLHGVRSLPIPTLALNNVEGSRPLSPNLYQFALSPENEAVQLANKAWQDGHRYAAILSPAVSTSDFYRRKRNSFIDQWLTMGGEIVTQEEYREDITGTVESLLDIDDSEARKAALSDLIDEEVQFIQRRRQDIDFIYLIAEPGPARQIHPTLAYLYAGDIPVYASQDVYSGIPRPLVDNDLNGIVFGDSPWLLSPGDELKNRVSTLFPQNTALTLRLQAFGIDAFRLYPRLKQLESVPDSQIFGATGLLRLEENNNIIRELRWATIEDGLARAEGPE